MLVNKKLFYWTDHSHGDYRIFLHLVIFISRSNDCHQEMIIYYHGNIREYPQNAHGAG